MQFYLTINSNWIGCIIRQLRQKQPSSEGSNVIETFLYLLPTLLKKMLHKSIVVSHRNKNKTAFHCLRDSKSDDTNDHMTINSQQVQNEMNRKFDQYNMCYKHFMGSDPNIHNTITAKLEHNCSARSTTASMHAHDTPHRRDANIGSW